MRYFKGKGRVDSAKHLAVHGTDYVAEVPCAPIAESDPRRHVVDFSHVLVDKLNTLLLKVVCQMIRKAFHAAVKSKYGLPNQSH